MTGPRPARVSLLVAMAENRVIGAAGELPWRLPADLAYFKRLTMGHPVLMGRKTFESIGRPLPGRRNLVLTRQPGWAHEGAEAVHRLEDALARTAGEAELFVIGGEQVYRLALPLADRLYLTLVHARPEGDAVFPEFDEQAWTLTEQMPRPADERNEYAMTFRIYNRR